MRRVSEIVGFHAHVYFDAATRAKAQRLRDGLAATFEVELGGWHDGPVGPHTRANCEVAFGAERFGAVVAWLMLNRDGLSVLVHPRTDDVVADHAMSSLWLGEPVALDVEFLRRYVERSAAVAAVP